MTSTGVWYSSDSAALVSTWSTVPVRASASGQVDDGIDHVQDGIDVVGDHDDGSVAASPAGVDEGADGPLLMQVEGDQRLVAQQQFRVSDQRLPDPEPLLFPAGQVPDPAGGERRWRRWWPASDRSLCRRARGWAAAARTGARRGRGRRNRGPVGGVPRSASRCCGT